MASLQEEMKRNRDEVLELRSQNASRSASMTQLVDTSTLRIGSLLDVSEPGSGKVEVMSVTDQPMDQPSNPGPSSTDTNCNTHNDHRDNFLLYKFYPKCSKYQQCV
jgi:hypothetical protein